MQPCKGKQLCAACHRVLWPKLCFIFLIAGSVFCSGCFSICVCVPCFYKKILQDTCLQDLGLFCGSQSLMAGIVLIFLSVACTNLADWACLSDIFISQAYWINVLKNYSVSGCRLLFTILDWWINQMKRNCGFEWHMLDLSFYFFNSFCQSFCIMNHINKLLIQGFLSQK